MVKEKRIVFDVNDLSAFRIECMAEGCHEEVLITQLDNGRPFSERCPGCQKQWFAPNKEPFEHVLLKAIRAIRSSGESPVRIKLELPDHE